MRIPFLGDLTLNRHKTVAVAKRQPNHPGKVQRRSMNNPSVASFTHSRQYPIANYSMLKTDLQRWRGVSRYEAINNPFYDSYIEQVTDRSLGAKLPKITLSENGRTAKKVEKAWNEFIKTPAIDFQDRFTLFEIMEQALISMIVNGECFLIKHIIRGELKLEVVDPCRLNDMQSYPSFSLGDRGQIVSYRVNKRVLKKDFNYWDVSFYNDAYDVPAGDMIHIFQPKLIDELRGRPHSVSVQENLYQLREYAKLAMNAAAKGASAPVFMKYTDAYDPDVEGVGEDVQDQEETFDEDTQVAGKLAPGQDLVIPNWQYPSGDYGEFVQAQLEAVSTGLKIPVYLLGSMKGFNFSSARIKENGFKPKIEKIQGLFARHLTDIFSTWYEQSYMRENPFKVTWAFPVAPHIQPKEEEVAAEMRIKNNLSSPSIEIAKRGQDPEDVSAAIKEDKRNGLIAKEVAQPFNPKAPGK